MTTYAISFRLEHDQTWDARYESFIGAVHSCKSVWEETTSFALVDTDETLEELERRLYLTRFSPSKDLLLVIRVAYDDAIARGKIADKGKLQKLLPGIQIK